MYCKRQPIPGTKILPGPFFHNLQAKNGFYIFLMMVGGGIKKNSIL